MKSFGICVLVALLCTVVLADHDHVPKSVCGTMDPSTANNPVHKINGGTGNFTISVNAAISWVANQTVGVIISGPLQWNGFFLSAFPNAITYGGYNNTRLGYFSNPSDGKNSSNYCFNADKSGAGLGHKDQIPGGIFDPNTDLYSTQFTWTAPSNGLYSGTVTFRATLVTANITVAYFPQTFDLSFGGPVSNGTTSSTGSATGDSTSSTTGVLTSSTGSTTGVLTSSTGDITSSTGSTTTGGTTSSTGDSTSSSGSQTPSSAGNTSPAMSSSLSLSSSSSSSSAVNSTINAAHSLSSSLIFFMLYGSAAVVALVVAFF